MGTVKLPGHGYKSMTIQGVLIKCHSCEQPICDFNCIICLIFLSLDF